MLTLVLMSLVHKIGLTLIKNVGSLLAKNLVAYCGSAEAVFKANKSQLLSIPGIGEKTANSILNADVMLRAEQELSFVKKHKIEVLFYTDDNYPKRLKNCYDSPVLLYYKGNADLNHSKIVSIVGTRNATAYGKQICKDLAAVLAPYNVLIVSGLAYGIDVAIHKECLQQQIPTVGILGHGLDRIYPQLHKDEAHKMVKNGGLLSEFPSGTTPDRENFPKRNRIIAGIADVVVVVEASLKGGALITAEIANSYNRDVYAFPGRNTDEFSEGCNFLIKTNRAGLINHTKDLIYYLGWDEIKPKKTSVQAQLQLNLTKEEQKIVTILANNAVGVDEIALQTNLPQSKLAILLLTLEMQGVLVSLPGKVYKLS
jgi:DNA processing protein